MGVVKVKEEALPGKNSYDEPVQIDHLTGYGEMHIVEVHAADYIGPANKDKGICVVMRDDVGNNRIGNISIVQLKKTLREIGYDIKRY